MSKFEINRTSGFFTINVNAILTLQLRPHVGHFDILKIYSTTFKDVQMMSKLIFDISTGFRY